MAGTAALKIAGQTDEGGVIELELEDGKKKSFSGSTVELTAGWLVVVTPMDRKEITTIYPSESVIKATCTRRVR